jgi:two-component system phosphate regulon response regulator PhoB
MEYLVRHRGRVFTRDELLDAVWGESRFVTPRSVDACVRRIRKKIEPDHANPTYLKAVRGVGYRLDALTRSSVMSDHPPYRSTAAGQD